MSTMIMIAQFFLSLSLLIVLHEAGHFSAARWFNTRVEKFYLFFDPWFSLIKKKIGDTEYGVGWLPLGGYVKIAGMIDESMDKEQMKGPVQPWEFRAKPAWQRLIIMLGGVIVNFLLGFLIFAMMLWYWGESYVASSEAKDGIFALEEGKKLGLQDGDKIISTGDFPFDRFEDRDVINHIILDDARSIKVNRAGKEISIPVAPETVKYFAGSKFKGKRLFELPYPFIIKEVAGGKPAKEAGIIPGDKVIGINGQKMEQGSVILAEIAKYKSSPMSVTIKRGNEVKEINLTTTKNATIGVTLGIPDDYYELSYKRYGFFESIPAGIKEGIGVLTTQFKAVGKMFDGTLDAAESLGGPIAIAKIFPKEWNAKAFWKLTATLSMILAFMNLLPIPALDGGHVMFLLWEMISGRKPSDKFMEITTLIGFIILMAFMILLFGNDIRREILNW